MAKKIKPNEQLATTAANGSLAFNDEISYMTLFPNTAFNNITEAYSVYGAGAFFVELMNIATNPQKVKPSTDKLSLKTRRPDLCNLPITQANIDNEIPYLQKVNELLLAYFKSDSDTVWKNIANGTTSFIPYNTAVAQVQTYLQAHNTNLAKLAPCFTTSGYYGIEWALAQTGLSKSDADVLANSESTSSWWSNLQQDGGLDTAKFKIITGLDDEDIYQLVYNSIPFDKRASNLANLYINQDDNKIV